MRLIDKNYISKILNIRKDIAEIKNPEGFFDYSSKGFKKYKKCQYIKEFYIKYPVRFLIAICGKSPYDELNINKSLRLSGGVFNMVFDSAKIKKKGKQLKFSKTSNISSSFESYSFLPVAVGHGFAFIPTGVVHNKTSHTHLLIQFKYAGEKYTNLEEVEKILLTINSHIYKN